MSELLKGIISRIEKYEMLNEIPMDELCEITKEITDLSFDAMKASNNEVVETSIELLQRVGQINRI